MTSEPLVLVLALGGVEVLLWVVKVVRLMAMMAVADDRVFDAFSLQLFFLVDSLKLCHQLFDKGLRMNTEEQVTHTRLSYLSVQPSFKCCFFSVFCLHCSFLFCLKFSYKKFGDTEKL